jgi:hypothetical protein
MLKIRFFSDKVSSDRKNPEFNGNLLIFTEYNDFFFGQQVMTLTVA